MIIEAQQEQIEFLQEKLSEIQAVAIVGGGESTKTAEGDITATDNADAPMVPPAPPPPPIDGIPMAPEFG